MDAMVTARIPVEVKEQGNAILRELGSSPTQLINAAYAYVLEYHSLPARGVPRDEARQAGDGMVVRSLPSDEADAFRASLAGMTLRVSEEVQDQIANLSYKEMVSEERMAAYEALA